MEKIKKVFESKTFRVVLYTIGVLAIVSLIFHAGMMSGFRRASFMHDWGNNYEMNFGSPRMGPRMMGGNDGRFYSPNSHGSIGKIIKIELPNIVVLDEKENTEKIIIISEKTEIRKIRDIVSADSLKIDDKVIIMGAPNQSGQIEARLIRLFPFPPEKPNTNTINN